MYLCFLPTINIEAQVAEIPPHGRTRFVILHSHYHDYRSPGDVWSQGTNCHGIALILPEYFIGLGNGVSTFLCQGNACIKPMPLNVN